VEVTGGDPDRLEVTYERIGGLVRIAGTALMRHLVGDVRQPVTIVLWQEGAKGLGGTFMGKLARLRLGCRCRKP
jgi:hypothetical protein